MDLLEPEFQHPSHQGHADQSTSSHDQAPDMEQ